MTSIPTGTIYSLTPTEPIADAIYGTIKLSDDYMRLSSDYWSEDFYEIPASWKKDAPETVVEVLVYNDESRKECRTEHGDCFNIGEQGTWRDNYSRLKGALFPRRIPLRLFINQDGEFKNDGDTLNLIYKGHVIVLSCQKNSNFSSFSQELLQKIQISYQCNKLKSIEKSVELAKANQEKWINFN